MDSETRRDLLVRRRGLAEEWRATAAKVDGSTPEFPRGTSLKTRVVARYLEGPREARRRALLYSYAALDARLATESVGATPGEWGVFSAVPPQPGLDDDDGFELVSQWDGSSLELTLADLVEQPRAWPDARALLSRMPALRASAALEGPAATRTVEDAVLRLAELCRPDPNRRLLEHLPLRCRPRVATPEDLERRNSMVALLVTGPTRKGREDPTARPIIELHDIVVNRNLRGQGLGTVVLAELCRFADETGQEVTGMLEPGASAATSAVPALARWYAGFGFRVAGQPDPAHWARRSTMTRSPAALD